MEETAAGSLPQATALEAPIVSRRRRLPKKYHAFFVAFTAIFVLLVLTGFSRRFFIPLANGTFSRPPIVHVHAMLFFAWTLLLFSQAVLASTGKLRLHRRIGSIAAWLVVPMLVTGTIVAARDTIHDYRAGEGDAALSFFYGELADLAMFGLLAGAAILLRNKPEFHKRLVIMGSLGLLGAAIGRIPEISAYGAHIFYVMIASVAIYDLASRRAVHRATLIGAGVLLALGLTEVPIGNTRTWIDTAHRFLKI